MYKNIFIMAIGFIALVSCGQNDSQQNETEVVVWAELKAVDTLSANAVYVSNNEEAGSLQETMAALNSAVRMLSQSEPPENAKNVELVKILQTDLQGLIVEDISSLSDEEMVERAKAVHSIAVKIMGAAGVPHVHEKHEKDHDDHEGHDH